MSLFSVVEKDIVNKPGASDRNIMEIRISLDGVSSCRFQELLNGGSRGADEI
jgi:hypothetical protein